MLGYGENEMVAIKLEDRLTNELSPVSGGDASGGRADRARRHRPGPLPPCLRGRLARPPSTGRRCDL